MKTTSYPTHIAACLRRFRDSGQAEGRLLADFMEDLGDDLDPTDDGVKVMEASLDELEGFCRLLRRSMVMGPAADTQDVAFPDDQMPHGLEAKAECIAMNLQPLLTAGGLPGVLNYGMVHAIERACDTSAQVPSALAHHILYLLRYGGAIKAITEAIEPLVGDYQPEFPLTVGRKIWSHRGETDLEGNDDHRENSRETGPCAVGTIVEVDSSDGLTTSYAVEFANGVRVNITGDEVVGPDYTILR